MSKRLDFKYTEHDYTLSDFLEGFGHQLPVIVNVTEGWGGFADTTFEYGAGEVYRICGVKKQRRVIARESSAQGRCFGIPLDHPMKFNLRRKDSRLYTDPMTIATIVRDYMRKTTDRLIIFLADPDPDTRLRYWDGPEKEDSIAMVELELEQCYDEKYLLAHCVADDGLIPVLQSCNYDPPKYPRSPTESIDHSDIGSLSIPAYLPIKVEVAIGLKKGTKDEFQKVLYDMYMRTRTWNIQKAIVNREVLLYHPYDESGNYDYIAPKVFLNVDHTKPPDTSNIKSVESSIYGAFQQRRPFQENRRKQEKPLPPLPGEEEPLVDESEYELNIVDIPDAPLEIGHNVLPERPAPLPRRPIGRSLSIQPKGKEPPVATPPVTRSFSDPCPPDNFGEQTMAQKRLGPLPPTPAEEERPPARIPASTSKSTGDTTLPTVAEKPLVVSGHKSIRIDKPNPLKPQLVVSPTSIQQRISMLRPVASASIKTPPNQIEQVYGDLCEVPQDIRRLTVQQLADCLQKLKLGQYANAFLEQNFDGELLKSMADKEEMSQMMEEVFHMKKFESHKLWMFSQQGWRPK